MQMHRAPFLTKRQLGSCLKTGAPAVIYRVVSEKINTVCWVVGSVMTRMMDRF